MSVTTFTTVNGRILRQNKDGVVHNFVSDPLGSVVMVRDTSGNTVYEAEYDPYGNVQSESGANPSSLGYVGTLGYIKDSATSMYVRARYLLNNLGRWLTKDPLWPSELGYVYVGAAPADNVDPTGLMKFVGCDDSFREKINRLCARIKEMTPTQARDVGNCVARTSRASNQTCQPVNDARVSCLQQFCRNGYIRCEPRNPEDPFYGECPKFDGPTDAPVGPIGGVVITYPYGASNFSNVGGGGGGDWSGRLTFLHEISHACGVAHGKYGGRSDCQCNDIYACCLFEILMGRNGNYCVDSMKQYLGKGGKC